jgi:hypothetical protein
MASSGTVANPTIDLSIKPRPGRDTVMKMGYVRGKSQVILEADALGLRSIRHLTATLYGRDVAGGGPQQLYGSVNTAGSWGNSITLTHLRGSVTTPAGGTWHVGTRRAGTCQFSFVAIGL